MVGEGGSSAAVTLLPWPCRTRQTPRAGHHTRWGPRGSPGRYQGMKGTSLSSTGQGLRWPKGPREGGSGSHQAQPTPEQVLCPRAAAAVSLMGSAQAAPGSALAHLGPCSQPWSPRAAKWPSRWKNSEQQTPLGRFSSVLVSDWSFDRRATTQSCRDQPVPVTRVRGHLCPAGPWAVQQLPRGSVNVAPPGCVPCQDPAQAPGNRCRFRLPHSVLAAPGDPR